MLDTFHESGRLDQKKAVMVQRPSGAQKRPQLLKPIGTDKPQAGVKRLGLGAVRYEIHDVRQAAGQGGHILVCPQLIDLPARYIAGCVDGFGGESD